MALCHLWIHGGGDMAMRFHRNGYPISDRPKFKTKLPALISTKKSVQLNNI